MERRRPQPELNDDVRPGDIIQIRQDADCPGWIGCLLYVEEVRSWGVLGYVCIPGQDGIAPYRAPIGSYDVVGKARWQPSNEWKKYD